MDDQKKLEEETPADDAGVDKEGDATTNLESKAGDQEVVKNEDGTEPPMPSLDVDDGTPQADGAENENVDEGEDKPKRTRKPNYTRAHHVARTNKAGLPLFVQRELAMDIENLGGIKTFKQKAMALKHMCDAKPHIYGNPGDKIRKQIQNKINYWQRMPPGEFTKIIAGFSNMYIPPTEQMLPPQSFMSGKAGKNAPPMGYMAPPQMMMAPMGHMPNQTRRPYQKSANAVMKNVSFFDPEQDHLEMIPVDTKYPERNREVQVFELTDIERDGVLYNGFEIAMEGDLRDFLSDNYSAHLVGAQHVLIRMPSVSYSYLHDHDEYAKQAESAGATCARSKESRDAARNRILKDKSRHKKFLLLQFPREQDLTNSVFSPDSGEDKEIEFELIPITVNVDFQGTELPMTVTRITWKIAIKERVKRKIREDEEEEEKKGPSKGAAKLARIFSPKD